MEQFEPIGNELMNKSSKFVQENLDDHEEEVDVTNHYDPDILTCDGQRSSQQGNVTLPDEKFDLFSEDFDTSDHVPSQDTIFEFKKGPSGLFECTYCPYQTQDIGRLTAHLKRHEVRSTYRCPQCSFSSETKTGLTNHCLRVNHSQGKANIFQCRHCPSQKTHLPGLEEHLKLHFQNVEDPLVDDDNGKMLDMLSLTRRIWKMNCAPISPRNAIKLLTCPYCESKFRARLPLKYHLRYHKKKKELKVSSPDIDAMIRILSLECPSCPKFYKTISRRYLERHLKSCHNKTIEDFGDVPKDPAASIGSQELGDEPKNPIEVKESEEFCEVPKDPIKIESQASKEFNEVPKDPVEIQESEEFGEVLKVPIEIQENEVFGEVPKDPMECQDRSKKIDSKNVEEVSGIENKIFQCPFCLFNSKEESSMMKHMEKYKKTFKFQFDCSLCNFSRPYKNLVVDHLIVEHADDPEASILTRDNNRSGETDEELKKCANCAHMSVPEEDGKVISKSLSSEKGGSNTNHNTFLAEKKINLFYCHYCSYTNSDLNFSEEHVFKIHLKGRNKCLNCEFCSKDEKELQGHWKSHAMNDKFVFFSGFSSENPSDLNAHISIDHPNKFEEDERKQIKKCRKCSYDSKDLTKHLEKETNNLYNCSHCHSFSSNQCTPLANHLKEVHGKKLQCMFCYFESHNGIEFLNHLRKKHVWKSYEKETNICFNCSQCHSFFSNDCAPLASHLREAHGKQLQCVLCSFESHDGTEFLNHLKMKHVWKIYKKETNNLYNCSHCHSFSSIQCSSLASHLREVHGKKLQCAFCPYDSHCATEFLIHLRKKHVLKSNVGKKFPFKCSLCPFECQKQPILDKHKKSKHHNFYKHYFCQNCPEVFQFKKNLERHRRNVHRVDPNLYKHFCQNCPEVFQYKKNLKKHQRNVHRVEKKKKVATLTEEQKRLDSEESQNGLKRKRPTAKSLEAKNFNIRKSSRVKMPSKKLQDIENYVYDSTEEESLILPI